MKKIFSLLAFGASLPFIAIAYAAPKSLSEFSGTVVSLANAVAGVIFALAFISFLWGLILLIKEKMTGEKDSQKMVGKAIINTGMIVLFLVVSLWGILRIVSKTFFD